MFFCRSFITTIKLWMCHSLVRSVVNSAHMADLYIRSC